MAYAGTKISPQVLAENTPAAKTATPVMMLMFPETFSGAKISSRMKRESADSLGSWMVRLGGEAPNKPGTEFCGGALRAILAMLFNCLRWREWVALQVGA